MGVVTTDTGISIVLALISACVFGAASVAQQRRASRVSAGENLIRTLIKDRWWWLGIGGDVLGYGLQVAALAFGPVLIVQPLAVTSLLFALPLSARLAGTRLHRTDWLVAGVLVASLAGFLLVGRPGAGMPDAPAGRWLGPGLVVVAISAICVVAGFAPRTPARLAAPALGLAGGVLFGSIIALTKPIVHLFEGRSVPDGVGVALTDWHLWVVAVCGLVGMYLQQKAYQRGPISSSMPAIIVGDPLAGAFLGATVLAEPITLSGSAGPVVVCCVLGMIGATVVLARRSPAAQAAGPLPAVEPQEGPAQSTDVQPEASSSGRAQQEK